MKILAIRAENLASLCGPIEIDLEAAPLGTTGVFAIVGPTGAGKSTLLDAMCLALFDKTPRLASRGGPLIGTQLEAADTTDRRLSSNDVRGLIRRGQWIGWAEVDFRAENGSRYRARWEARRARNATTGRWQAQTMSFLDVSSGRRIGDKKTEVLAAIEERLGLDFDQFQRSVLLAQGDFASFLKAGPTERSELLEKVTKTTIYGDISVEVYKSHRELAGIYTDLVRQRDQLGLLADGEKETLNAQLSEISARIFTAKGELDRLRTTISILEQRTRLRQQEEAANERVLHMGRIWESHEGDRQWLDQLAIAEPAREWVVRVDTLNKRMIADEQHITALTAEVTKTKAEAEATRLIVENATRHRDRIRDTLAALQPQLDEARRLDQQVMLAQETTAQASRELTNATLQEEQAHEQVRNLEVQWSETNKLAEEITSLLTKNAAIRPLFLEWDRVELLLRTWTRWNQTYKDITKQYELLLAKEERLLPMLTVAQNECHNTTAQLHAVIQTLVEVQNRATAIPLSTILANRKQAEDRRNVLDGALAQLEARLGYLAKIDELTLKFQQHQHTADMAQATQTTVLEALKTCRTQLDEAARANNTARAALRLVEQRSVLVNGEPCPLCGSLSHPWADSAPPLSSLIEELSERVRHLESNREKLQQQLANGIANHNAATAEQQRIVAEQDRLRQQVTTIEKHWETWVIDANRLGLILGTIVEADPKPLENQRKTAVDALSRLETEVKAALALNDEIAEKTRTRDTIRAGLEHKLQQVRELEDELRQVVTTKETFEARKKQTLTELEESEAPLRTYLEMFPTWQSHAEKNLAGLMTTLQSRVQNYANLEAKQQELTTLLAEVASRKVPVYDAWERAKQQVAKRQREYHAAAAAEIETKAARTMLLGGESTNVILEKIQGDIDEAETALVVAATALADKNEQAAAVAGRLAQATAALLTLRDEQITATKQRDDLVYSLGLDLQEIDRRLSIDPTQKREVTARIENLAKEWTLAQQLRDEKIAERTQFEQSHPVEGDRIDVTTRLHEVENDYHTMVERRSEINTILTQDATKLQQALRLTDQLKKIQAELEILAELNEVVGSADGKKFRTFAQSLTLDSLLSAANLHLRDLAPRYRLERVWGQDLDLQVRDQEMGDDVRAIQSLSGGETFLASLALALALSSMTSSNTRIESLFIDEGFGTLDGETLEVVLHTLDSLQATGRQIGIISHVATLAERIGTRIEIVPTGGGRSRLQIRQR